MTKAFVCPCTVCLSVCHTVLFHENDASQDHEIFTVRSVKNSMVRAIYFTAVVDSLLCIDDAREPRQLGFNANAAAVVVISTSVD